VMATKMEAFRKDLYELLGRSASGIVVKGIWQGTPIAKKTFHATSNSHPMKEVEILLPLYHPNITSIFSSAKNQQNCAIIMEMMDEDLHTLI
jgi:hypothetical protein